MRQTHIDNVIRWGDKWTTCPRCGFDVLESELVIEYTGKKVCWKCKDDPPTARNIGQK